MLKNKRKKVDQKDQPWMTCKHVMQGTAREVWCRPDGIALCTDCIDCIDNLGIDNGDVMVLCPICMESRLKSVPIVEGREFVERAAISCQCRCNKEIF